MWIGRYMRDGADKSCRRDYETEFDALIVRFDRNVGCYPKHAESIHCWCCPTIVKLTGGEGVLVFHNYEEH